MWKEFTRERPARRGWTVATLALAFIGTLGLAKIMVDVRAEDSSVVSGEQSPLGWPISFTLPSDHRWRHDPDRSAQTEDDSSDYESMVFVGQRLSGGHGILWVSFRTMPPGTRLEELAGELAKEMFEEDLGMGEEIAMGPIEGRMAVSLSGASAASVVAFGCTPEGLAIVVVYVTRNRTGDERRVVRSVCESLEFKGWRSRR